MPPKRMVDRSAEHGTKRARQRLNHTANAVSALNSTSRTHEPPLQVQNAPGFPVQRAETSNWRTQHIPSLKTSHVPRPSASANRHLPIAPSDRTMAYQASNQSKHPTNQNPQHLSVQNNGATSSAEPRNATECRRRSPGSRVARRDPTAPDSEDDIALAALTRLLTAESARSGVGDHDLTRGDGNIRTSADHTMAVQMQRQEEMELRRDLIARDAEFAAQLHAEYHNKDHHVRSQPNPAPVASTSHLPPTRSDTRTVDLRVEDWRVAAVGQDTSRHQQAPICSESNRAKDRKRQRTKRRTKRHMVPNFDSNGQSGTFPAQIPNSDYQHSSQTNPSQFSDDDSTPLPQLAQTAGSSLGNQPGGKSREIIHVEPPDPQSEVLNVQMQIVLDTNIVIAHLDFLRRLMPLLQATTQLLVPKAVLTELDLLKSRHQDIDIHVGGKSVKQHMAQAARDATNWLLQATRGLDQVVVQRMEEETKDLSESRNGDARILAYALNVQRHARDQKIKVALFSNDNLLRLNAQSEGILALSIKDVRDEPLQLITALKLHTIPAGATRSVYRLNPLDPQNDERPIASIGISQSRSLGASLVRDDHSAPSTFTGSSEARPATTRLVKQADKATKHAGSHTQSGCSTRQLSVEPVTAPGAAIESFSLVAYWPAGRLIPRSNLIISRNESAIGPDVEFSTYKGILNVAGICGGCHFRGGKTLKTAPALAHHACEMCLEVVCKGCWRVTGCNWECTAPFLDGEVCGATVCCATGRAVMLYEILCQLDSCFLSNNFKLSLKTKQSSRPTVYQGDQALIKFLLAIQQLLPASNCSDQANNLQHPSLKSMILSSTLLEVLCRVLTMDPLLRWNRRSQVHFGALNIIRKLCIGYPEARSLFDHRLVKYSTCGLRLILEGSGSVVWKPAYRGISPTTSTSASNLLTTSELRTILGASKTVEEDKLNRLRNKPINIPLYDILGQIFTLATMKMEEFHTQFDSETVNEGESEVVTDEIKMIDAILDLATCFIQYSRSIPIDTTVLRVGATSTTAPDLHRTEGRRNEIGVDKVMNGVVIDLDG